MVALDSRAPQEAADDLCLDVVADDRQADSLLHDRKPRARASYDPLEDEFALALGAVTSESSWASSPCELNDERTELPISHTSAMATGLKVGGDVEQALDSVGVPSYVLDTTGVVRWINAAAERLVGDVRGRQFTSVVAAEDSRRARELFSRKVLGSSPATRRSVRRATGWRRG